ncbi:MAG TPA: hypothetical protein VGG68_06440 [Caulobacteraceae bacterium]|jgi:hypothetical protein
MASAAQLEQALRDIVTAEREEIIDNIADGGPEDYATYREYVGQIRTLDQFTEWLAEAAKRLDEV